MSDEPFFKSQADTHAWRLERPGRKVTNGIVTVGYASDGALLGSTYGAAATLWFACATEWWPAPDPVPWYEHPEAVGALVREFPRKAEILEGLAE